MFGTPQLVAQSMVLYETKKKILKEQQEKDRDMFGEERKLIEEGHAFMEEMHKMELRNMETEVLKYKESKEEMETMYREMQTELELSSEELQTLRTSRIDSDSKLLERVAELERMNAESAGQLLVTANVRGEVRSRMEVSKGEAED